jgi:hypothetical protein
MLAALGTGPLTLLILVLFIAGGLAGLLHYRSLAAHYGARAQAYEAIILDEMIKVILLWCDLNRDYEIANTSNYVLREIAMLEGRSNNQIRQRLEAQYKNITIESDCNRYIAFNFLNRNIDNSEKIDWVAQKQNFELKRLFETLIYSKCFIEFNKDPDCFFSEMGFFPIFSARLTRDFDQMVEHWERQAA